MTHKSIFPFFVFIFLMFVPFSLLPIEIELFSWDYNDEGDAKINILFQPVYDEEQIKKDAQQTEQNKQEAQKCVQEIEKKEQIKKSIILEKEKVRQNIDRKRKVTEKIITQL